MTATLEPTMSAKAAKAGTAPTPADVIRKAKEAGVQMVDVRFTDLPGTWQHFSLPLKELTEAMFAEGVGFDGSSSRGFQAINESDMLLVPDPASAFVDPCLQVPTLALTCDVVDRRAVETDALGEHRLGQLLERQREVLPGAGQIGESDIHHLHPGLLRFADHVRRGRRGAGFRGLSAHGRLQCGRPVVGLHRPSSVY